MLTKSVQYFADYIQRHLGIVYADHNAFQLEARLGEISEKLRYANVEAMHEQAVVGSGERVLQLLLDAATNNETLFFRDPKVFQALETTVLPELKARLRPGEKLKVWSAASSFGQEPYSVAMLLSECQERGQGPDFSILATDVSRRALDRAELGRYSSLEVQRGLSETLKAKYFVRTDDDRWAIAGSIKAKVSFREQNLKEPVLFGEKFHVILCRNVLIYQSVESKTEIVERLASLLEPGGYFIMGAGESMLGISSSYDQVPLDGAVFFKPKSPLAKSA